MYFVETIFVMWLSRTAYSIFDVYNLALCYEVWQFDLHFIIYSWVYVFLPLSLSLLSCSMYWLHWLPQYSNVGCGLGDIPCRHIESLNTNLHIFLSSRLLEFLFLKTFDSLYTYIACNLTILDTRMITYLLSGQTLRSYLYLTLRLMILL